METETLFSGVIPNPAARLWQTAVRDLLLYSEFIERGSPVERISQGSYAVERVVKKQIPHHHPQKARLGSG